MKAIVVKTPGSLPVVEEIPVPEPGPGEVLIKIEAAPVNPSDLGSIKRNLAGDFKPFTPGLEGAGTVVKAGKGLLPRLWLGKRVACSPIKGHGGTWAEYMVTGAGHCFPLGKSVSSEQGSMTLVNPLTALGFIEIARKGGHKAIVNNAAASSLGRMTELLCKKYGIKLINIVRSAKKAEELRWSGSAYVLDSSDPSFTEKLKNLSAELNARLLFDSVCGDGFNELIASMPDGSTVVIYGNLSPSDLVSVNPRTILSKNITIKGFYLGNQSQRNGMMKNMINLLKVRKLMAGDMKIKIQERYPLANVNEAIEKYTGSMSSGKVLLIP